MVKTKILQVRWGDGFEIHWVSPYFKSRKDLDTWMEENRPGDTYEDDIKESTLIEY